jgi:hypothetical protein
VEHRADGQHGEGRPFGVGQCRQAAGSEGVGCQRGTGRVVGVGVGVEQAQAPQTWLRPADLIGQGIDDGPGDRQVEQGHGPQEGEVGRPGLGQQGVQGEVLQEAPNLDVGGQVTLSKVGLHPRDGGLGACQRHLLPVHQAQPDQVLQAGVTPAHLQRAVGQPGALHQTLLGGQRLLGDQRLLTALQLALTHHGHRRELHLRQAGLQPVQGEREPAGHQQPAVGLGRVECPHHPRQHARVLRRDPAPTRRVGDQDLFQVVDDQQQRPLPGLTGLRARPGQQINERSLDRLRPRPHLSEPGRDQVPGRGIGPDRVSDRVQDPQRTVVTEYHRDRQVRASVHDPRRQTRLTQPALSVQQHPGTLTRPQHPQRLLQLQPPAHEHLRGRDRHPILTVQEHLGPSHRRHQRPFPRTAHQRTAAGGAQPHPRQMPLPPHERIRLVQQRAASIAHRHLHLHPIRQPRVQPLREHRGSPVIDRPVPPDHRRHARGHQRRRQRVRRSPALGPRHASRGTSTDAVRCGGADSGIRPRPGLPIGLVAIARPEVTGRVGARRGQAGRYEHQPRDRRQTPHQIRRRRGTPRPQLGFHHQRRHPRPTRPVPVVVHAMTRQVHHRQPTAGRQPMPQLHRLAGVLNQQVHAGIPDRGQDRRLLRLEVQLRLVPRRRSHERQPQPQPVQTRRRAW